MHDPRLVVIDAMMSLVRRFLPLASALLALACGRSWRDPPAVAGTSTGPDLDDGGTSSSSGRLDADDGEVGEVDDGDADDGDPTVDRTCLDGPDVRWLRFYDGPALRTMAGDLERGPDGTLYMAGARADGDEMVLWIAAAAPDGTILWERTALPDPGGNRERGLSLADDLVLAGDVLSFAGVSYEDVPFAWHGRITLDGDFLDAEPLVDAAWYGVSLADDGSLYLAGRNFAPDGALLVHRDGDATWSVSTAEASLHSAFDAGVISHGSSGDAFVAGCRDDYPWIGRIDASSGQPVWERAVLDTGTFETGSGQFWAIAQGEGLVAAAGDVHLEKRTDAGNASYDESFLAAWTPEGEPLWSWQPSADELLPGSIVAMTVGPDGTLYVTGEEHEIHGEDHFFAAAFSPEGEPLGAVDWRSHGDDPDLVGLVGRGVAAGDEGQLFVLAERPWSGNETTALLELCL